MSMKQLPPKNEGEELLKALETIDSKDNDMVDLRVHLNTDLSKQYVMSQKQERQIATPPTLFEPRLFTPSSEKPNRRDEVLKRRTFQQVDSRLKETLQQEFKRQLEYLKSPYDTFHDGRLTKQTLQSQGGKQFQPEIAQTNSDWPSQPAQTRTRDSRPLLKHIKSHQVLPKINLPIKQEASEHDRFEERLKRYVSLAEFDPLKKKQQAQENYRKKYMQLEESEIVEQVIEEKLEPVVARDLNLEVKFRLSDQK